MMSVVYKAAELTRLFPHTLLESLLGKEQQKYQKRTRREF